MKLHYALAALAVAAMSFSASAADPVNLMAGWAGSGQGAKETPADFGWIATPDITWSETFTGPSYLNGYRDDLGLNGTNIRGLLITQTNSVIAYPVKNMTKGVYKFSVNAAYMNHGGIVQTFDFNSKADGTGVSYGKTTITNAAKWGAYDSANFEFALTEDVETVYMCWTVSDTKDRRVTWNYSLVEYTAEEYASTYAAKKTEAQTLLSDEAYKNVTGSEKTALEAAVSDAAVEPNDYKQAVINLVVAMDAFKAAAPAYNEWEANKSHVQTMLGEEIASNIQEVLNKVPNTAAEATEANEALIGLAESIKAAYINKVLGEGEDIALSGWTKEGKSTGTASGQLANFLTTSWFENYQDANNQWGTVTSWDLGWYKEIELEPGTYTFAVFARSANNIGSQDYYLYINDDTNKIDLPQLGDNGNTLGRGWDFVGKQFTVAAPAVVEPANMAREGAATVTVATKLGLKFAARETSNSWVSFTGFTLRKNSDNTGTGVEAVEAEENAPAVYYNLNGVRVDGNDLTPGVYVVRRGAKAEKILVK